MAPGKLGGVHEPAAARATQKDLAVQPSTGITGMKTTTAHALTIVAVVAAMSGCQSGPRSWAWWKSDAAPADTSAVARSADPQLPSAQAAAPVAVPGLQPATSPSAANLASAGAPNAAAISIPPSSPSMTANAPLANYPAMDAAADKLTAPSGVMPVSPSSMPSAPIAAGTSPQMATRALPQMASAGIPPSGPYDPNSYRPSTTASAGTAASAGETTASPDRYQVAGDRYGVTPVGPAPMATEQPTRSAENVPAAPPATKTTTGDRYGYTTPESAAPPQASVAASQTPVSPSSPVAMTPTAPMTPVTASSPATVASLTAPAAAPAATATVQTTAPAGQYRPGGTSTYVGAMPAQHIEVATRPAPPATTSAPAAQPYAPAGTSVPWAPGTTTPTPSSGTQRY